MKDLASFQTTLKALSGTPAGLALLALGAAFTLRFAIGGLLALYTFFLRPAKNLKKYGSWAVVTGATDGIGKAYAIELARRGLNVLLISRTTSKLEEVQKEISEKYNKVTVKTLVVDFSDFNEEIRNKTKAVLEEIKDIAVLVNNVGLSYDFPMFFSELEEEAVKNLLELNVSSVVWMTRLVLPLMEQKRKGAIVNISSGSSVLPCPLLSEYSAAKGFVNSFTRSLAKEAKAKGVDVQVQFPMFVTTKLSKIRRASFFTPSPKTFAVHAVNQIGYETAISPYWPHALQIFVVKLFPEWLQNQIVWSQHISLRSRALKKLKQK